MAGDLDKINEIFRIHDEKAAENNGGQKSLPADGTSTGGKSGKSKRAPVKAMDRLLIDETGKQAHNYTGDAESERDYRPVRQSHEYKSGCLGGIMYFAFILCISVVLACLAWMAASDMLALNKPEFSAKISLPMSAFESETVDTFDEKGNKTGTERVTRADMEYVANQLKDAGLIEYKWLFEAFCKVSKADTKVRPGEYELQSSYDYRALIQNMRDSGWNICRIWSVDYLADREGCLRAMMNMIN